MEIIVATILFLAMVVSWFILPATVPAEETAAHGAAVPAK